jgi:hypothetical protein
VTEKRTRKLEQELERLRRQHADLDRSAVELERLVSPQASLSQSESRSMNAKINP